eukprot:1159044-Pelagomonas_calceolata.AAC.5
MTSNYALQALGTQKCAVSIRKARHEHQPRAKLPTLHTRSCLAICKRSSQPLRRGLLLARSVESNSQQERASEAAPQEQGAKAEGDGVGSVISSGEERSEESEDKQQEEAAQLVTEQTAGGTDAAEEAEWYVCALKSAYRAKGAMNLCYMLQKVMQDACAPTGLHFLKMLWTLMCHSGNYKI